MNYFLSAFTGMVVAVMIAINGFLTRITGSYLATVIIHICGLLVCTLVILILRPKIRVDGGMTLMVAAGGLIGVGATVFNNVAFLYIGVTPITALGLLGQTVTSVSIDAAGVFGPRPRYTWRTAAGIALLTAGIVIMLVL
ncbi:MAG: DMT family transporter [Treponema sp.]|jgi:transporter family-2 protein|nr:DMT family transporter [Treponema sp.]